MKTVIRIQCATALFILTSLSTLSLHAQTSLSLNGSLDQYVQVPASTSLTPTSVTFEAWVYPTVSACNTIISRGDGGINSLTDYIFDVGYDGTNCGVMKVGLFAAGAWNASSGTVPLDAWTHVAVTYDGTNKLIYINGVLDTAVNLSKRLHSTPDSPLYIGRQGTACDCNFFNGQMSEVRIWNTVRTASQIQGDMNFSFGSQPGLVAYYHFDEGTGPTAYDASGNGNIGTLENGATWAHSWPPRGPLVVGNTLDSSNTLDSVEGSLRDAVGSATNGQEIVFDPSLSGAAIQLENALAISSNLTIDASALPGGIQIDGFGKFSEYMIVLNDFVITNAVVTLNSITITNCYGIANYGNLTMSNCTLSGNSSPWAGSIADGGGIYNVGVLTMNNCTVSGNSAIDASGGGIYNDGTLKLYFCSVSGNDGNGGIYNDAVGSLTMTNCTVSRNNGTGLYNNQGYALLYDCTLSGNVSSDGGGIFNYGGTLTLNDCTLSGNSAPYGGGGGIVNDGGTASLNECTVSGNLGGGIVNLFYFIYLRNTVVAGNDWPDVDNYNGVLNYDGPNLVQSVTNQDSGTISGHATLTNAPDLAPLGNYGGPTQTMPPLPGSPVIGAGSVVANPVATDQRGYPRTQGGLIDIGAVELPTVQPFNANPAYGLTPLTVQFSSTNTDSDGSAVVEWNWSFGNGNTSTKQDPTNAYNKGIFSPGLIVTNSLGLALAVSGPAITVVLPALAQVSLSGTNLTLSGNSGISGLAYTVLTSTNLNLPLSQWTPLSTNIWSANGAFSLTLTNVLNPKVPAQFYLLQVP